MKKRIAPNHRTPCVRNEGFTWIEILLVCLGIFLLAAVFLPRIGGPHSGPSPVTAARADIAGIGVALDAFHADTGFYPIGTNGLYDLLQQPAGATNWHGPYLDKPPKDPWGHSYIYDSPSKHASEGYYYDLVSLGPPGQNTPIANWTGFMPYDRASMEITLLETALENFRRDTGDYPTGRDSLIELVRQPANKTNWHGPYLQGIPKMDYLKLMNSTNWLGFFPHLQAIPRDPWGHEYVYTYPGKHQPMYPYDLISQGPPGKDNEIANWRFKMMLR